MYVLSFVPLSVLIQLPKALLYLIIKNTNHINNLQIKLHANSLNCNTFHKFDFCTGYLRYDRIILEVLSETQPN